MAGNDTNVDTAELELLPLQDLYGSIQDHLRWTIEEFSILGRRTLAGHIDDVLLRQKLWEVDICLQDGALSDLEASDVLAFSIIRLSLDETMSCCTPSRVNPLDRTSMFRQFPSRLHPFEMREMSLISMLV